MHSRKLAGYSLPEMLIALAVLMLIALISVFGLNSASHSDELRTAARQISADIRSAQSRALEAQNVKACSTGVKQAVCENLNPGCISACQDAIPNAFGVYMMLASSTYQTFADINPATPDYMLTDQGEVIMTRSFLGLSSDVKVDSITSFRVSGGSLQPWVDASFTRQSGTTHIIDPLVATLGEPSMARIVLRHAKSGQTITIEVNRVTGRVSAY